MLPFLTYALNIQVFLLQSFFLLPFLTSKKRVQKNYTPILFKAIEQYKALTNFTTILPLLTIIKIYQKLFSKSTHKRIFFYLFFKKKKKVSDNYKINKFTKKHKRPISNFIGLLIKIKSCLY